MKLKPNVIFSQNLKRTSHATPAALGIKEGYSIKVHLQLTMNSVISPERSIMFCVIFDKFLFFFLRISLFQCQKKKEEKTPLNSKCFFYTYIYVYTCIYQNSIFFYVQSHNHVIFNPTEYQLAVKNGLIQCTIS